MNLSEGSSDISSADDSFYSCRRQLPFSEEEEKIQVFSRLRPHQFSKFTINGKKLNIVEEIRGAPKTVSYIFSGIFDSTAKQVDVFNKTVLPAIYKVLSGEGALIFSYGTTSCGKTYTIQGTADEPGIIPRAACTLFCNLEKYLESNVELCPYFPSQIKHLSQSEVDSMEKDLHCIRLQMSTLIPLDDDDLEVDPNTSLSACSLYQLGNQIIPTVPKLRVQKEYRYSVWVSYIEIYQENIYDLLDVQQNNISGSSSASVTNSKNILVLGQEPETKHYYVKGLKHYIVNSWAETLRLFLFGRKRLQVNSTNLNLRSSRSHSIFTIKVVARHPDGLSPSKMSSFSICDLAGCERSKKTMSSGKRMKEANVINLSMMTLNRCLEVIRNNQKKKVKSLVPYRDSNLTKVFQKSLVCGESIAMIVNISQDPDLFEETRQVLRASAIAQDVKLHTAKKYVPSNPRVSAAFLANPPGMVSVDAVSLSQFDDSSTGSLRECIRCQGMDALKKEVETIKEKYRIEKDCFQQKIRQIQKELDETRIKLSESSAMAKPSTSTSYSSASVVVLELHNEVAKLTWKGKAREQEIMHLTKDKEDLLSRNNDLIQALETSRKEEANAIGTANKLENENRLLRTQLTTLASLIEDFKQEMRSVGDRLIEKDNIISKLENEIENYNLKMATYEGAFQHYLVSSSAPNTDDEDRDDDAEISVVKQVPVLASKSVEEIPSSVESVPKACYLQSESQKQEDSNKEGSQEIKNLSSFHHSEVHSSTLMNPEVPLPTPSPSSQILPSSVKEKQVSTPALSKKKWNLRSHKKEDKCDEASLPVPAVLVLSGSSDEEFLPQWGGARPKVKSGARKGRRRKPNDCHEDYITNLKNKEPGTSALKSAQRRRRQLYQEEGELSGEDLCNILSQTKISEQAISPLSELRRQK